LQVTDKTHHNEFQVFRHSQTFRLCYIYYTPNPNIVCVFQCRLEKGERHC
jgi:hypothetical protein